MKLYRNKHSSELVRSHRTVLVEEFLSDWAKGHMSWSLLVNEDQMVMAALRMLAPTYTNRHNWLTVTVSAGKGFKYLLAAMSARLPAQPVAIIVPDLWTLVRRFPDGTSMPSALAEMLSNSRSKANIEIDAEFSQGFPSWDMLGRTCEELEIMNQALNRNLRIIFNHMTFDVKRYNADTGLQAAADSLTRLTKLGAFMKSGVYIRGCSPADVEHMKKFLKDLEQPMSTEKIPKLIFNVKPKSIEHKQRLTEVFECLPRYNFKWQRMLNAPAMMKFTLRKH